MKRTALEISTNSWAALSFVAKQVIQGAEPIIAKINQLGMLQNPAATAHFSACMHLASLVKPGGEFKVWKRAISRRILITQDRENCIKPLAMTLVSSRLRFCR